MNWCENVHKLHEPKCQFVHMNQYVNMYTCTNLYVNVYTAAWICITNDWLCIYTPFNYNCNIMMWMHLPHETVNVYTFADAVSDYICTIAHQFMQLCRHLHINSYSCRDIYTQIPAVLYTFMYWFKQLFIQLHTDSCSCSYIYIKIHAVVYTFTIRFMELCT